MRENESERGRRLMRVWLLMAAVAFVAASCSGGGSDDHGSSDGAGLIATATDGTLRQFDLQAGEWRPLMEPPVPGARMLFPSASPDGARITYVVQPPAASEGAGDAGYDLWVADRDGANARVVFEHIDDNQQVTWPQWIDNERILAVVQEETPTGVAYVLERFDLTTGARDQLRQDVYGFGVSPATERLATVELEDDGLKLYGINADGGDRTLLLSSADGLSPYWWPRYSPDGTNLAMGSSLLQAAPAGVTLVSFGPPPSPAMDGLPQDIWMMAAEGGPPRVVARLQEDSPTIAWGADGVLLYAYGQLGLFEINVETGAINRLAEGQYHGHIATLPALAD